MTRTYPINRYRNFGIMAHIDAGKTTTTERILYYTGRTHKIGEVHEGNTTMDHMVQERERGITITSAATTTFWKDRNGESFRFNIIDTPGHVDFTIEVERSLRVLDGAIALLDGNQGVEPQTETVWRQADKYNVPRLIFVNKMDKTGADFYFCLDTLHKRLGIKTAVMQLPIGAESTFSGIIDLIEMNALVWQGEDLGAHWEVTSIPEDPQEKAKEYRTKLIELAVELDDSAMDAYLGGELPSNDTIRALVRKGTINGDFFPVFCGTAFKNKGVQPLLDGVVDYLPAPTDIPAIRGTLRDVPVERHASDSEPLSMLAFKVANDTHMGSLTFCRIYSGHLTAGLSVENTVKGKRERVGKIYLMHANERQQIEEAFAGDIVALLGLKDTTTGDTLADPSAPVILSRMDFPEPVIDIAVEPATKVDQEKMSLALVRLAAEDPSFRMRTDAESGQTIISGMGELHLEIILDRMDREFDVKVTRGNPQVAYRETISRIVESDYTHKKQTGGSGQFAQIKFRIEPNEPGAGFTFASEVVGGNVPKEYVPGVEKGVRNALGAGILIGFPIVDIKFTLTDGSFHPVDSSALAFEIAGNTGFRKALAEAGPKILEPIMRVEVIAPDEFVGSVIGDLHSRRGKINGTEARGVINHIHAEVPLANMFGYISNLRGMSKGRGNFDMVISHYETVPTSVAQEIQLKYA